MGFPLIDLEISDVRTALGQGFSQQFPAADAAHDANRFSFDILQRLDFEQRLAVESLFRIKVRAIAQRFDGFFGCRSDRGEWRSVTHYVFDAVNYGVTTDKNDDVGIRQPLFRTSNLLVR